MNVKKIIIYAMFTVIRKSVIIELSSTINILYIIKLPPIQWQILQDDVCHN